MKELLKKGLLSVALLATVVASASELNNVKVSNSKKLDISLSKVVKGEILSITNKKGATIYSETLSKADLFTKSIDFSKFTQGVYYVTSTAGLVTKVTPFIIVPSQSKVVRGETKIYSKPVITFDGNIAKIVVENEGNNPVTITVYGGGNNLDVTVENTEPLILKRYDFSSLKGGEYTITVKEGDKIYREEIKL